MMIVLKVPMSGIKMFLLHPLLIWSLILMAVDFWSLERWAWWEIPVVIASGSTVTLELEVQCESLLQSVHDGSLGDLKL